MYQLLIDYITSLVKQGRAEIVVKHIFFKSCVKETIVLLWMEFQVKVRDL